MSEFQPYENLEAVDKAQSQLGADGKREYQTNARLRAHVEHERIRLTAGEPVPEPVTPTLAGVTGISGNGQRGYAPGHEPDERMLALCAQLQARRGPDGRRLVEVDAGYRADVEASLAEAISGARWSRDAEDLSQRLADEAKAQAKDAGLYRGAEKAAGFTFDRSDPAFQDAAAAADRAGLSDTQFRAMLGVWLRQTGVSR